MALGFLCFSAVQYLISLKCKTVKSSTGQKVKVFPSQRQRKCTEVNIIVSWLKQKMNV